MARYKYIDTSPRFLAIDLARQLLPGTFEHALNHLLDHAIELSHFDARFRNDETGALAYSPAMLLKVVLFAYSQGIVSSRSLERACQEHVTFIALCGDTAPHFTTIAHFVSTLNDDSAHVFAAVLAICDAQCVIGREMFAIDGVKLPSNASKHRSGTRADFERHAAYVAEHFRGAKRDCVPCVLRAQCLRTPDNTIARQVAFFRGRVGSAPETQTARMKQRIDSPAGRARYGQRLATVEPAFANLQYNEGLDRFTLRGQTTVDGQWKLFCLVHNIEKLAKHGYAA